MLMEGSRPYKQQLPNSGRAPAKSGAAVVLVSRKGQQGLVPAGGVMLPRRLRSETTAGMTANQKEYFRDRNYTTNGYILYSHTK